jgi:uncharacterized secreted protein with C-terminal beta-propeller domain
MSDNIFKDMRRQMTPDEGVLSRLDTALDAEPTNATQGENPVPAPPVQPPTPAPPSADKRQRDVARRRRIRTAYLSAAAALVLVLIAAGVLLSGRLSPSERSLPPSTVVTGGATAVAGAVRAPADYEELYLLLDGFYTARDGGGLFGLFAESSDSSGAAGSAAANAELAIESSEADTAAPSADADAAPKAAAPKAVASADAAQTLTPTTVGTADSYSETNVQVEGIDEADIVKTDGSHIYALYEDELVIFEAAGARTQEIARVQLVERFSDDTSLAPSASSSTGETAEIYPSTPSVGGYVSVREMYLSGSVLAALIDYDRYLASGPVYETQLVLYDVSDPAAPALLTSFAQSGDYTTSRLYDGMLYLVSSYYVPSAMAEGDPGSFVPLLGEGDARDCIAVEDIRIMPDVQQPSYTVVASYDLAQAARIDQKTVLGGSDTSYMSHNNLYLGSSVYTSEVKEPYQDSVYTVEEHIERYSTQLIRVGISAGTLDVAAQCVVNGGLLSQFSLDEYEGNLRLVVTVDDNSYRILRDESHNVETYQPGEVVSTNALYVLNPSMEVIGSIEGLAEEERIYSARFTGPVGYMVTYRQVDPLFALDLSDPTNPRITSELKIPGFSTYLHPFGEGRLLGFGYDATGAIRNGMKLSMFDTSDAFDVTERFTHSVGIYDSEALSDHKAVLVDAARNIIGFPVYGDYDWTVLYFVYGYDDAEGFTLRGELTLGSGSYGSYGQGTRGLFIGEHLYVFSSYSLDVFDLTTLEGVKSLEVGDPSSSGSVMPMMAIE